MEVGHLLLRWWGRGPDVGQSCTALGAPDPVSLFWNQVPILSLQHNFTRYNLFLFSLKPSARGTLCASSQSKQAEPSSGDITTNLGFTTVSFFIPHSCNPFFHRIFYFLVSCENAGMRI